jgi:hypothetical protein
MRLLGLIHASEHRAGQRIAIALATQTAVCQLCQRVTRRERLLQEIQPLKDPGRKQIMVRRLLPLPCERSLACLGKCAFRLKKRCVVRLDEIGRHADTALDVW